MAAGRVEPARNPVRFFVFLAFFGHGPSGPIVRYGQQLPQLDPRAEARRVTLERFCYGIKRLVFGLAKKAVIADQLALIYQRVTSVPAATLPAPILVLGYAAYMMQLYFDFSGYSDMAIGIGAFFGLELPENFNYPYLARTVGEYWRRWHITLSSWFRDYVYIPLGGSRCSTARTCRNLLVVFVLTGLWHGAAWQYVVFGLLHGLLLCAERLGLRSLLEKLPRRAAPPVYAAGALLHPDPLRRARPAGRPDRAGRDLPLAGRRPRLYAGRLCRRQAAADPGAGGAALRGRCRP